MSIPGLDSLASNGVTTVTTPTTNSVSIEAPESLEQATISSQNGDERRSSSPKTVAPTPTTPSPPPPTTIAPNNEKLCGVCKEQEWKYKCSRCYLPYCSVACSKIHLANHPPDEPKPIPQPEEVPKAQVQDPRLGTAAAAGYKGPFAVLEKSPELRELFKQFPDLPKQLEMIDNATLRPTEDHRQHQYGKKQQAWNQDKGWQSGVDALQKARRVYGRDGEGVREFGRVVLLLLEREREGKEIIQKELDDESTRIIRQLLELERESKR